jgi:GNAT superfamily N-acetyltransferase
VLVRPIRPEDAEPLRAGFDLLEPERLRLRLADGATGVPSEGVALRLTRLNPRTDFMLVASDPEPPGEAVIAALAHVRTDVAGHRGEFTVLVSRFIAGMGVGRYLLTRLAKWARSRRLDVLQGDVPAANTQMLELARSLGFREIDGGLEPGYVRVSLEPAAS